MLHSAMGYVNALSGHHLAVYHGIRKVHLIFIVGTFIRFNYCFIPGQATGIWVVVNQFERGKIIIIRVDNPYCKTCCSWLAGWLMEMTKCLLMSAI